MGIILKKCRTWTLKHSCNGPNHSFSIFYSYFKVVVQGAGAWYFYFGLLAVQKMEKVCPEYHKCVGHIFKKIQKMGT